MYEVLAFLVACGKIAGVWLGYKLVTEGVTSLIMESFFDSAVIHDVIAREAIDDRA